MRIESLTISRYRSLYGVSLRPGDLTVVVGPNNAGKTNLVDAVDFLAEAYRFGLEVAVGRKGGFENIAHRKVRRTNHLSHSGLRHRSLQLSCERIYTGFVAAARRRTKETYALLIHSCSSPRVRRSRQITE